MIAVMTSIGAWSAKARAAVARRLARRCSDADAGFVSLYVVVITVGLLAMGGLVIDGGTALAARQQAMDTAQQAARAGADALSPAALRDGSPDNLSATPQAAQAAANRVLATNGVTGSITVSGPDVTVTVEVRKRTTILAAVGLTEIRGTATATATALFGTTEGGP